MLIGRPFPVLTRLSHLAGKIERLRADVELAPLGREYVTLRQLL